MCTSEECHITLIDRRADGEGGDRRSGGGGLPSRLSEYAGWYFWVYVLVHRLRRESSTRGWLWVGCPSIGLGVKGAGSKK